MDDEDRGADEVNDEAPVQEPEASSLSDPDPIERGEGDKVQYDGLTAEEKAEAQQGQQVEAHDAETGKPVQVAVEEAFEFDFTAPLWEDVERGVGMGVGTPLTFSFGAIAREVKGTIQTMVDALDVEEIDPGIADLAGFDTRLDNNDQVLVLTAFNVLGCFLPEGRVRDALKDLALRIHAQNQEAFENLPEGAQERGKAASDKLSKRRYAEALGLTVEELDEQIAAHHAALMDDEIAEGNEDGEVTLQ